MFRAIATALAAVSVLVGLLWIGQGTGLVRWPASSFMIDVTAWAWRGAALVAAGLIGILVLRRKR